MIKIMRDGKIVGYMSEEAALAFAREKLKEIPESLWDQMLNEHSVFAHDVLNEVHATPDQIQRLIDYLTFGGNDL